MRRYLLGGATAAAAIAMSPTIAQVAQPAPAPQVMIQRAPMAAKVHTRAEVGTHVRTMFERLDSNRDGFVTKAEAQAVRADRMARRMARHVERRGAGSPGRPMMDRGAMFDRIDTNRDGSISRAEFEAAPMHQERRIVMRADRQPGTHHEGMRMKRGMRMGMGMGLRGHMFDMADANKDGRVTLQEATAAAYRHFDMADSNRDGQVTREERMQMRHKMRAQRRPG